MIKRLTAASLIIVVALVVTHAGEPVAGDLNVKFVTPPGDKDPGLWGKWESAPVSDGKVRLRAFWTAGAPAKRIVSENGSFVPSGDEGATYEFFVLVENVGTDPITVPSVVNREPRSAGMKFPNLTIIPYIVKLDEFLDLTFIESEAAFRPVKLSPGEMMRLPIYYLNRANDEFGPQWFFYAVDETLARRYGWWWGALKCKAEDCTARYREDMRAELKTHQFKEPNQPSQPSPRRG